MSSRLTSFAALLSLIVLSSAVVIAQEDAVWRVSPERLNIQVGQDRRLQLLDDSAQEVHGAEWCIDQPELAELREENGMTTIHAKAAGSLKVNAVVNFEKRSRQITIWPADKPLPPGTTHWGTHGVGRDIRDLAAVPAPGGVNLFSLEQTEAGHTYLRGFSEDGIQDWSWLLPEKNVQVELVCGDWLGGALISSNHADTFTLYSVGKDGKLQWQHTLAGIRKAHAYNLAHLVHILSQSPDRTVAKITALDEVTGVQKFELIVPASHEKRTNVRKVGTKLVCESQPSSSDVATGISSLFVNIDGFAYATRGGVLIAFSVMDGKEVWRWDSHTSDIEVFAALANGGCVVQTPTALVEVDSSTEAKEIFKGKATLDWHGQLLRKEN